MVKKIFTKMTLASTLFLGSVLGASIVNGIENKNDASIQNRTVNVKRSSEGKSEVEYLSFVITFDKNDPKTNFTKVIYDKDDPTKAAVTVLFEKVNYTDSKLGEDYVVEATIEKNTAVSFTPGEGYEIDKITTLATAGGAFGSNSPTLTNVKSSSSGNRVELTPIDKSKQVKVKNFTHSYTYCYNMTIEYHKSVFTQKFDDTTHWIGCDCGTKKDVVNHTWDTRVFTTAPTHEAPGEAEYTCKCGKTKTDIAYPSVQDSIAEVTLVNSLTYNGIDQTQEIEVTYAGVKLEKDTHYTISGNVKKDAGEYTLTIEGTGLFEGTRTIDYTIAKAPLTITADSKEVTYGDVAPTYTASYNGFVGTETKDVLSGELALSCAYDQYADAGNYPIVASGLTSNNYEITYVDGNLKVNPKEIGLEWSTNLEFTYDGEAHKPTATVTGLVNNDTCTVTVVGEKVNAGTHTATAEVLSNSNYKLPTEGLEKNYIINPKSISGATITFGESLTYTGNELTQEVESVVLDGVTLVEGTDYEVSANKQTNAGTEYELIITGIGNYTGTLTKEFVVAKQKVDLPTANSNLVYIGTEVTGVASSSLYNVTSGTAVNAGTHTATVTLKDSSNYEWIEEFDGTVEYTIGKAPLTISVEDKKVTYGDIVPTYTVSYDGLVNNETSSVLGGTLSFACTYSQTSNVGQYDIVASGLTSDNYDITYVNGKVTVSQKEVGLTWGETQFTYNGSSQLPVVTLTGLVNNDTCTVTVTGEQINAGSYEATVTALSNENYKLPNDTSIEYVINKATHNMSGITFNNVTVTYDGSEHEVVLDGTLPTGVEVTYSTNKGTNAGTYNAVATFTYDTANYNVVQDMNATLTINKATHNMSGVSFNDVTVTYNGNEHVVEITGTLPSGVTVTYENNKGTNAGVYNAVAKFAYDTVNYNVIENKTATLTINKATHNMSGISFNDVTVTYDGNEHEVVLEGTLPSGVEVTYTTNKGTNAGTYNAVATFTYDTANYNVVQDMNATLTINKATHNMSGVSFNDVTVTYNGNEHEVVLDGTLPIGVEVTYTTNKGTNVGTYNAVATFTYDTANYNVVADMNAVLTISKATYDMSGISFTDKTVVENKQNQALKISGTLPSGVTVSYSLTECVEPGIYEIIASFTGDAANYNTISPMKATLVIKQVELKNESDLEEGRENDVIVSAPEGIDPTKELFVELVELEETDKDLSAFLEKGERVAVAYDVKLLKDGAEVQPDGTLKIKILIPEELRNRNFSVMHVHNDTEKTMLEYQIEGDYVVVETDKLSEFAFVYETGSILWLVIVLGVLTLLESGLLVYLLNLRKKQKLNKVKSVYPPFIFGMFIPGWQIVMVIILIVLVAVLAVIDVFLAISLIKGKQKEEAKEEIEEDTKEDIIEEILEEEKDDEEDDVIKVWDEEKQTYTVIRLTKSFEARLIQSNEEIKSYYDVIKNELLSYKKVKSKVSFKHESFKFGKNCLARLKYRGKTLCLYLALDPKTYGNTKYKVEDMSEISYSSEVPSMYRIHLPRRVNYAKDLIKDVMTKFGVIKTEIEFVNYSTNYSHQTNEELIEKGLIKKSVKEVKN